MVSVDWRPVILQPCPLAHFPFINTYKKGGSVGGKVYYVDHESKSEIQEGFYKSAG